MLELPTTNVDPDRLDGTYNNPRPGRYYGEVNYVDECDPKTGKMIADLEVLSGDPPDQVGKTIRAYFELHTDDPAKQESYWNKIRNFAIATGLTSVEEIRAAKEAGLAQQFDFETATGRKVCFEVEDAPKCKAGVSVGFGIYHVNSPKAKGIPLPDGGSPVATQETPPDPFGDIL